MRLKTLPPGIFLTVLGRGPRAFLIGTISEVNSELGNFKFYTFTIDIFQSDIA